MQALKVPTEFIAIDKMSKEFKKMQKNVGTFVSKTEMRLARLERRWRSVGQSAARLGRTSLMFATAIIAPMGLMVKSAVEFEQSMSNVSTLIDTNVEDIGKMGDKILEMSETLPVPINELTDSLYGIRSAGISAADQFDVLEASAKLSVAGLATTEEATKLLTGAINTFADDGLSANEIADVLFKTVKSGITTVSELTQSFGANAAIIESAGVTLKEFQSATAALTTSTTPASVAQTQLKAAVSKLQKPTADMTKIFKDLGVTTGDELIEKSGGLVNAFFDIQKSADKMGVGVAKAFGSSEAYAAFVALTGGRFEAFEDTMEMMNSGVNLMNEAFDKQSQTGKSQMQIFKNQIQSLSISMGKVLIPIVIDLMKQIKPMIKSFGDWAKRNKELLGRIMKIAVGVAGLSLGISGISFAVAGFAKAGVFAFKVVGGAMKVFSAMAAMNPFVLMIAGAVALGAALFTVFKRTKELSLAEKTFADIKQTVIDNTADELVEMKLLFAELRNAKVGTEEYSAALAKIEEMQPGITEQYNLQEGALKDIAAAERELAKAIMERAAADAIAAQIRENMEEIIKMKMEGPEEAGFFSLQSQDMLNAQHKLQMKGLQDQIGLLTDAQVMMEQGGMDALFSGQMPVVNTDVTKEEVNNTTENKETIDVNVNLTGAPEGTTTSVTKSGGVGMPNLSTTN